MRRFKVDAPESPHIICRQDGFDVGVVLRRAVGVLVKLGLDTLHFLEQADEAGAGVVAPEGGYRLRRTGQILRFHEAAQAIYRITEPVNDGRHGIHQPDIAGDFIVLFAGKKPDGFINGVLLLPEVKDISVWFGIIKKPVGA